MMGAEVVWMLFVLMGSGPRYEAATLPSSTTPLEFTSEVACMRWGEGSKPKLPFKCIRMELPK